MKYLKTKKQIDEMKGEVVAVYRNLHKNCWSVTHKGRVIYHCDHITLENVKFKVSKIGREKVLKEKRKNVHARVWGELVEVAVDNSKFDTSYFDLEVTEYNPYKFHSFFILKFVNKSTVKKFAVTSAEKVFMTCSTVFSLGAKQP